MKEVINYGNYQVFDEWNRQELDSFLVEITRDILAFKNQDGVSELDNIYDSAGQVGDDGNDFWTMITEVIGYSNCILRCLF